MGQKVNPIKFRLGINKNWKSRWIADKKTYRRYLLEDIRLREAILAKLKLAGIASVEIERLPKSITVVIRVSRPGVVIGRGGTGIEDLKRFISKETGFDDAAKIDIRVEEVKNPELSAKLVAERIANELERRLPHRRVVTRTIERIMAAGAEGVEVVVSGRIGGAEIARTEKFKSPTGSVPKQTLRENIDYAEERALLKRGYVGIKVWINKGKRE